MADDTQKAPDKGGFPVGPGNFGGDVQIAILERISRSLEEAVHKAIEEYRAIQQILKNLRDQQVANQQERQFLAKKKEQFQARAAAQGAKPNGSASLHVSP
jgi:hypothetical protein